MTPGDALETYCPLFTAALIICGGDIGVQNNETAQCLGDLCMFWRWKNPDDENDDGYCGFVGKDGAI